VGTSKTRASYLLLLLPFVYLQIFYGLGALGLVGPDEPRYAEVAKEMFQNGDYITPRLSGQPWLEKPILYYWIATLSFRLFGVSESAARLVSAWAAVLGILAVVLVGRDWIGFRGGVHAALILSSCILYFSLARAASTDMLLTGTLTAAWTGFYFLLFPRKKFLGGSHLGGEFGRAANDVEVWWQRTALPVLSYFFLALSVLAKGPVGLILLGGVLALFLLLTRRFEIIKQMRVGLGVVIVTLVAGPWYWLCYRANRHLFIEEFLLRQNLERFTTDRYQHLQPFWFYFAVIFVGFFPWVFQLFSSAARFPSRLSKIGSDPAIAREVYLWLWVMVPLVFFSLSRAKLPGYILPTAPSLALLVAREFELGSSDTRDSSRMRWFKSAALSQALFIGVLGFVLPFAKQRLNLEIGPFVSELQGTFIGVGLLGLILAHFDRVRALLALYLSATAVMVMFVIYAVIPRLDPLESQRQLALTLKQEGFSDQPIYLLGLSRRVEYGLNFYLDTTTRIIYSEGDLRSTEREAFLLTPIDFELTSLRTRFNLKSQTAFHGQKIIKLGAVENSRLPSSS
jgi:4-amino-4-deoxy-L-arabinose transferase-like glycosyltransferase